jgi:TrmH family RNA methyltransferase
MPAEIIRSSQNASVKRLRKAFACAGRDGGDIVALEGDNLLQEALRSGVPLTEVFVRHDSAARLASLLHKLPPAVPVHMLAEDVFNSAASTEAPQGIAATIRVSNHGAGAFEDLLAAPGATLIVVLDAVQDPGNVGTILRSAEAFGADCVVRLPGTASDWNLKAMRASAGSVFRVPSFAVKEQEAFASLTQGGVQLVATLARDGVPPDAIDWTRPTALLVGSEGRGLSGQWIARAHSQVTIPMPGGVESLNAAIATSLLLYEASKQRMKTLPKP